MMMCDILLPKTSRIPKFSLYAQPIGGENLEPQMDDSYN